MAKLLEISGWLIPADFREVEVCVCAHAWSLFMCISFVIYFRSSNTCDSLRVLSSLKAYSLMNLGKKCRVKCFPNFSVLSK